MLKFAIWFPFQLASISVAVMAEVADQRKGYVQTLRRLARTVELEPVSDRAAKAKVKELGEKLSNCQALGSEGRKEAGEALEAYLQTFGEQVQQQEKPQAKTAFRLRGRSFLCTYNWDFEHKPFPDGTPVAA